MNGSRVLARSVHALALAASAAIGATGCGADDTSPVTYGSCTAADAAAADWQGKGFDAERRMEEALSDDAGGSYEANADALDEALLMHSRIIVSNPACFPPDVLVTAMKCTEHGGGRAAGRPAIRQLGRRGPGVRPGGLPARDRDRADRCVVSACPRWPAAAPR